MPSIFHIANFDLFSLLYLIVIYIYITYFLNDNINIFYSPTSASFQPNQHDSHSYFSHPNTSLDIWSDHHAYTHTLLGKAKSWHAKVEVGPGLKLGHNKIWAHIFLKKKNMGPHGEMLPSAPRPSQAFSHYIYKVPPLTPCIIRSRVHFSLRNPQKHFNFAKGQGPT